MFSFLQNHAYPIGVDMGDDSIQVVQLGINGKDINLIAIGSRNRPAAIEPGSSDWQRWAVEALDEVTTSAKFHGREVTAALPAGEVFIDHIKIANTNSERPQDVILSKIEQKLPFDAEQAMIKHIASEGDNVVVMATDREKVNRHLAIYEKAQLTVKSIGAWPTALTNTYTRFFGRRQADIEAIIMLLEIESNRTNVVICRHKNLLFVRSIPIGVSQLESDQAEQSRLILELTRCRRRFGSMYRKARIERLLLLSARGHGGTDKNIYTAIAKQLEMPTQVGDCLAAVEISDPFESGIDRRQRQCQVNWSTAFGLSLSLKKSGLEKDA